MRGVWLGVMGLALAACTPAAETPAKPAEHAEDGAMAITPANPFFGSWEIIGAKIAPWWDGKGEEPAPDPAMTKFTLGANASTGPDFVACAKPQYATNIRPERGLFEGGLPDPVKDAAALGFKDSSITVLSFSCAENNRDVSLDFPMIDDDTIALGLDNVIYTFKRVRG